MASAADLRRTSTALTSCFFLHSGAGRLLDLDSHAAFLAAIARYNATVMKLVFVALSLVELCATCVIVVPALHERRKDATRIASACLVAASFVETILSVVARDTNATATFALLFFTCAVRLLELHSSIAMRTFHGSLGSGTTPFDAAIGKIRDAATRYKAASLCTLLIGCVVVYTACSTDALLSFWAGAKTSTLRRNIALSRWYKASGVVALLSALGSSDTRSRFGRESGRKGL